MAEGNADSDVEVLSAPYYHNSRGSAMENTALGILFPRLRTSQSRGIEGMHEISGDDWIYLGIDIGHSKSEIEYEIEVDYWRNTWSKTILLGRRWRSD